ncbi:DNA internalization-related competence protein ComEC/Rec2 [Paenibacillus roseipurpureus]|uniref:DNA internalization-related competence protein ComEC/Rec2 n=1 Tax=Paenibacillus roseopurpureus TaxID=2918901 RepID=A0AA96LXH6_9BACL|nr:DNA internalization-related competence protein ComEC/Rec2 [Paenibacillus sp. MBLB1832]WNR46345.1 DNA internalization-related competence protein ComEC/Rec2 [Paenibacillus sp. MBLB1832]
MRRPVVLGCCLWISGYALAIFTEIAWLTWTTSALLLAALVVMFALRLPGRQALGPLLLVVIAYGYYHGTDQRNITALPLAQQGQVNESGSEVTLLGRFASPVTLDGDRASFTVEAASVRFQDTAFPLSGESVQVSLRLTEQEQQAMPSGWRRGDALTIKGTLRSPSPARNFGGFDYRRYLRLHHTHWLLSAKGVDQAQVQPAAPRLSVVQLLRWNDELRAALSRRMDSIFPASQAGFMKSMLIGLTDDLDPDRFQQFSELGLTHILAISGLNIAVFLAVCIWIMRRLRLTKEKYLLVCLCLLPLYILLTGASPSIIRAGLMSMIAIFAARQGGLKDVLHILAVTAWAMLIWNPYYLLDVSFQLSFLVTLGLILGVQRVTDLLSRYIDSPIIQNTIAITLVSQAVSFPVSIYYFNQFSLLSWLANAVLVPVISMVVFPAGLVALALGLIYVPIGRTIGWLIAKLNEAIFWMTDHLQQLPHLKMIWPSPSLPWMVLYYLALLLLYFLAKRNVQSETDELPIMLEPKVKRTISTCYRKISLLVAPSCFGILLWIGYSPHHFQRTGLVQFLDVGQGDSILIRTPYGKHILIDGGGTLTFHKPGDEWKKRNDPYEVGKKLLTPLLKKRGIQQLDLLVLTHEDADHSGGLQAVVEQVPVKQFLFNGTFKEGESMKKLFSTLLQHRVPLLPAQVGDWIVIDPVTRLQVLFPLETEHHQVELVKEQNARSVVFLLEMLGTNWLFTGDMEKESEAEVLQYLNQNTAIQPNNKNTKLDVLKVAHHGSKTSSTPEWLAYWQPHYAVISVGVMNSYGHPSPETIEHLDDVHAAVFRTDQMGEIQMEVRRSGIYTRMKLKN